MGTPQHDGETAARPAFTTGVSNAHPTSLEGLGAPARPSATPPGAIVASGSRGIGHQTVSRPTPDGYAVVVGYAGTGSSPSETGWA
ncbi:hypothetical protein [Streptomyces sp. NPDC001604]|uniref:hypothetical protein n=1 Tax=Streptomyces sp. NPDC001604 TaxID=3364593 RepID=UPI00368BFFBD